MKKEGMGSAGRCRRRFRKYRESSERPGSVEGGADDLRKHIGPVRHRAVVADREADIAAINIKLQVFLERKYDIVVHFVIGRRMKLRLLFLQQIVDRVVNVG